MGNRQSPLSSQPTMLGRPSIWFIGSSTMNKPSQVTGKRYLGQKVSIRIASAPIATAATSAGRDSRTDGQRLNRWMNPKVPTSSAVSNTAGMTVENDRLASSAYSIAEYCSVPT